MTESRLAVANVMGRKGQGDRILKGHKESFGWWLHYLYYGVGLIGVHM